MNLKARLRHKSESDVPQARRFLRQIRAQEIGSPDDLWRKVDFIYKVFFREEGAAGLDAARQVVEKNLPEHRDALFLPTVQALTYSKNFEGLHTYLDEMEAQSPGHPDLIVPRVHAHLHQGDVTSARDACWASLETCPNGSVFRQIVKLLLNMGEVDRLNRVMRQRGLRHKALLRARRLPPPDPNGQVPVFCINLDRDTERLERARFFQGTGTVFNRSPGVSGSSLPRSLLAATGMTITVPRIAQVGCHLAHMKAWEAVADTVDEDAYGLVTEDDAVFIYGPGRGLDQALDLAKANDLDMLFINYEPMQHRPFDPNEDPSVLSIDAALSEIYPKTVPGWGGEAYLLSPKGARKLIEMSTQIGIVGALDWQIALYGAKALDEDMLNRIAPLSSIIEPLAAARAQHGQGFHIDAGVLTVPLMRQLAMGYTAHNIEISLAA